MGNIGCQCWEIKTTSIGRKIYTLSKEALDTAVRSTTEEHTVNKRLLVKIRTENTRKGRIIAPPRIIAPSWKTTIFQIKKNPKSEEKKFFFQKNASKAVKNLYTKKWPKFFYNENDSKMVKNLYTKSDCKKVFGLKMTIKWPKKFLD